jgi:signal transduction histidine kinase
MRSETRIGAIALNAEMLRDDVAGMPAATASVEKILRAARRLDRIVGDVLSFASDTRIHAASTSAREILDLARSATARRCSQQGDVDLRIRRRWRVQRSRRDLPLVAQAVSNLICGGSDAC